MRSGIFIVNDILDKEFDAKYFEQKIALSPQVNFIKLAIIYSIILCFLALLILLNFNLFTIILALGSMPLALLILL